MKKYLLGAILALGVAGIATPTLAFPIDTFAGFATFSDTSPVGNNPAVFTGVFTDTLFSFAPTSVGQTFTDTLVVTGGDSALLRSNTYSDNIAVSLNFFLPGIANGTIDGTGSIANTFFGAFTNGTLTWGAPITISFTDGSVLTASMANFSINGFVGGASGSGDLTLKLTKGPSVLAAPAAVPEPVTLSIFGAGVVGAGVMRRRRKQAKA